MPSLRASFIIQSGKLDGFLSGLWFNGMPRAVVNSVSSSRSKALPRMSRPCVFPDALTTKLPNASQSQSLIS